MSDLPLEIKEIQIIHKNSVPEGRLLIWCNKSKPEIAKALDLFFSKLLKAKRKPSKLELEEWANEEILEKIRQFPDSVWQVDELWKEYGGKCSQCGFNPDKHHIIKIQDSRTNNSPGNIENFPVIPLKKLEAIYIPYTLKPKFTALTGKSEGA